MIHARGDLYIVFMEISSSFFVLSSWFGEMLICEYL